MSSDSPIDYILVLADLEFKRDALDKAIASVRMAAATGALTGPSPSPSDIGPPAQRNEIPNRLFQGRSIADAVVNYL